MPTDNPARIESSVVYFTREHPGDITCRSQFKKRCGRRGDLWPSSVRCVETRSLKARWLSECASLGTGGVHYTLKGTCNESATPACSVEFDIDDTLRNSGWGWHYYLLLFTIAAVFTCAYASRTRRSWARQLLV